jgi:hypothetical protein
MRKYIFKLVKIDSFTIVSQAQQKPLHHPVYMGFATSNQMAISLMA